MVRLVSPRHIKPEGDDLVFELISNFNNMNTSELDEALNDILMNIENSPVPQRTDAEKIHSKLALNTLNQICDELNIPYSQKYVRSDTTEQIDRKIMSLIKVIMRKKYLDEEFEDFTDIVLNDSTSSISELKNLMEEYDTETLLRACLQEGIKCSESDSDRELIGKIVNKLREKRRKTFKMKSISKRKPTEYNKFVKKHMSDKKLSKLTQTDKMKTIAKMWNKLN